jgi:hypothetical protein
MIIEAWGDWFIVIIWCEHAPSQPKWSIKEEYNNIMLLYDKKQHMILSMEH